MSNVPDAPKKGRRASIRERVEIFKLLEKHFSVTEERTGRRPGEFFWEYDEGWSDERIRNEVNPELSTSSVHYIRLEEFGPLNNSGGSWAYKPRAIYLENCVRELCKELGKDPGPYLNGPKKES